MGTTANPFYDAVMLGLEQLLPQGPTTGERRRGKRFDLRLKCSVCWLWGKSRILTGVTEDFSRSGILVRFPDACAAEFFADRKEPVKIVVELPQSPSFPGRCLECMGNAVRLNDGDTGRPSVAFEIGRIRVRDASGQQKQSTPAVRAMRAGGRVQ